MADKRAFDLNTLVDQANAFMLADRSGLSEAQKIFISNIITKSILQIFDNSGTELTATNTQDAIKEVLEMIQTRTRWMGVWDESTQYYLNDMVRANTWLMVAVSPLPTIGVSPVPIPEDNPYFVIDLATSQTWETVATTSWFYTGLRAETIPEPHIIVGGRVWLQNTSGIRQVITLSLIDENGDSKELASKIYEDGSVTTTGWENVLLSNPILVYPGQQYEVGLFTESLGGETMLHQDSWIYNGVNNNPSNVYYGSATQSSSATVLYIHEYSVTSQLIDFSNMLSGDIITQSSGSSEWAFELNSVPVKNAINTEVWEFTGTYLYKIGEIDSGTTIDYEFVRPGGGALSYVKITNGLSTFPNFSGRLDTLPTNDVYGIDFYIDDIYQNTDWNIMSNFGGSNGSGGTIGDTTITVNYIPVSFSNSPTSSPIILEKGKYYSIRSTAGEVTCKLPLAPDATNRVRIYISDSSTNDIIISGNGKTINGTSSVTFSSSSNRAIIEFIYNIVDGEWKAYILNSSGGGGASSWEDLTDVTTKIGNAGLIPKVSDDESLIEFTPYTHDQVSSVYGLDVSTWENEEVRPLGARKDTGTGLAVPENVVPVVDVYDIDAADKAYLEDENNWLDVNGDPLSTISPGFGIQGNRYSTSNWVFECAVDGLWLRYPGGIAYIDIYIDDSVIIALLINTGNWTGSIYSGTAIDGAKKGQRYIGDNYVFEFYDDNLPCRVARI